MWATVGSSEAMQRLLRRLRARLNKTQTPCVKFTEMHIVQRYLERPLTFCGYKLDLRIYVLILAAKPLRDPVPVQAPPAASPAPQPGVLSMRWANR